MQHQGVLPSRPRIKAQPLRYYNCGGVGHRAHQCPGNALFCQGRGWLRRQGLTFHGKVEGQVADNILLDTGCSKTVVWRELVPREKILHEQVPIWCAHGDTVMYPLANIEIQLGGVAISRGSRVRPVADVVSLWHRCATVG